MVSKHDSVENFSADLALCPSLFNIYLIHINAMNVKSFLFALKCSENQFQRQAEVNNEESGHYLNKLHVAA